MSKKHFEAIANALREARDYGCEDIDTLDHVTRLLADVCARFNGNFDRGRFYRAAGME